MKDAADRDKGFRAQAKGYGFIGAVVIVVLSAVLELTLNFGTLRDGPPPALPIFTPQMAREIASAVTKVDRLYDWHAEVDENGVPMWYDRTSSTEQRWYEEIRRRTTAVHDVLEAINDDTGVIRDSVPIGDSWRPRPRSGKPQAGGEQQAETVAGRPCHHTTATRGPGSRHGMMCCRMEHES